MMDHTYAVLVILFFVGLATRFVYERLKEAHRLNPENKYIFAVILTAMCVLWLSWFSLCPADPAKVDLPSYLRWIGLAMFVLGFVLAVTALIQLGGVENIDHLVTKGVFKKLRHPMYLGFICWFLGWSLYHTAIISLAIGLIGIANVLWWRHLEERRLQLQFGESYSEYQRTTWF